MTQVTIDEDIRENLTSAKETLPLIHREGRIIGTFHPIHVPPSDESLIPPTPVEELRRRESEPGGRRLPEIFKDLRKSR